MSDPTRRIQTFLSELTEWARERDDILAVALAGSHARGEARPDSDVDLGIYVRDIAPYLDHTEWVEQWGRALSVTQEDWGAMQSLRVFYDDGLEVEFGISTASWASTAPLDAGTMEVVAGGFVILFERDQLLTQLLTAINGI